MKSAIGLALSASARTSQPALASSPRKRLVKFWFIVAIMTSEKTIRLNIAIVMPGAAPGRAGVGDRGPDRRQLRP